VPTAPAATGHALTDFCAIDFGTSNSAVALPGAEAGAAAAGRVAIRLVPLEGEHRTMPTAVFYATEGAETDGPPRCYGRAALAAYVEGRDGRLMRSMKSILGSTLAEQRTDVGAGRSVAYLDVVAGTLRHLKQQAEQAQGGAPLRRVVIGRPVRFVDDDDAQDARAQAALAEAAARVGFEAVRFQYEPIAAALDHEQRLAHEERVLVADIGGGTSDFCVVRVGPARAARRDRADDILAHHGVHVAGTDFDRRLELQAILPACGYGARGPARAGAPPREVPSRVYHDLATWHLINTVYAPQRVAELRAMRGFYAEARHHARLMTVVQQRLGHELAARAEAAKIALGDGRGAGGSGGSGDAGDAGGTTDDAGVPIDLGAVEPGLQSQLDDASCARALEDDLQRIEQAALETLRRSGLRAQDIDTLYFTGGSTGLVRLVARIAARFPHARVVHGDPFASVARGLGVYAVRWFGGAA
jgi:hypothetical chaperone protein